MENGEGVLIEKMPSLKRWHLSKDMRVGRNEELSRLREQQAEKL